LVVDKPNEHDTRWTAAESYHFGYNCSRDWGHAKLLMCKSFHRSKTKWSTKYALTKLVPVWIRSYSEVYMFSILFPSFSSAWWLMTGAGLFWEKNTAGWFILREKYCWLVADKPNEQGAYRRSARSVRWLNWFFEGVSGV
jgi:hypothetical protein